MIFVLEHLEVNTALAKLLTGPLCVCLGRDAVIARHIQGHWHVDLAQVDLGWFGLFIYLVVRCITVIVELEIT